MWIESEAKEIVAIGEVFRPNSLKRRPERGKRTELGLRILEIRFNENVDSFVKRG